MIKISIALATFNGEKYIKQQLDSLLGQKALPFELVIGDDGSSDNTLKIIEDFSLKSPFPVKIIKNSSNLGFSENFHNLAINCSGDWVSFCDQDDIWLPNKISDCINTILENDKVILILQKCYLSDNNAKLKGRLFPNHLKKGIYKPNQIYGLWVWLGFLQTFNLKIIKSFNFNNRPRNYFKEHGYQSHDKWTCMLANAIGDIIILDTPVALYRRHNNALTGDYKKQSVMTRIKNALDVNYQDYTYLSIVAEETSNYLNEESKLINNVIWQKKLLVSSEKFGELSLILSLRAKLYYEKEMIRRMLIVAKIILNYGYFGSRFHSLGTSSFIKDTFRILFGSKLK